jgi:hypothetical protein
VMASPHFSQGQFDLRRVLVDRREGDEDRGAEGAGGDLVLSVR